MPQNPAAPVANNKVIHGARVAVSVNDKVIGIFTSVSYSVQYSTAPIFILGRTSAAEIALTGMDVVNVSCHGWRVLDHGPFANDGGAMSTLQNLLTDPTVTLSIQDKLTQTNIATVKNCRVTRFSTQISSRNPQDIQVDFVGTLFGDEATPNGQADYGLDLP